MSAFLGMLVIFLYIWRDKPAKTYYNLYFGMRFLADLEGLAPMICSALPSALPTPTPHILKPRLLPLHRIKQITKIKYLQPPHLLLKLSRVEVLEFVMRRRDHNRIGTPHRVLQPDHFILELMDMRIINTRGDRLIGK